MNRHETNNIAGKTSHRRILLIALLAACLGVSVAAAAAMSPHSTAEGALPMYISGRMASASNEQVASLEDGVLDRTEYAEAFDAYGECATTAGARIAKARTWSADINDFELWVEIPAAEGSTVEPAVDGCWDQHVGVLQDYWHWQADGSPSETDLETEREAVHARIVACLEQDGIQVGDGSPAEFDKAMAANRPVFKKCVVEAQGEAQGDG